MDLSTQPVRAVPKSVQLHKNDVPREKRIKHNRGSLTRRQRSEASPKVRKEVHERSGGVCEKCDRARSAQLAHIERRWKSESKPTAEDFADLCVDCHTWCDSCDEGRQWLLDFQDKLIELREEKAQ